VVDFDITRIIMEPRKKVNICPIFEEEFFMNEKTRSGNGISLFAVLAGMFVNLLNVSIIKDI